MRLLDLVDSDPTKAVEITFPFRYRSPVIGDRFAIEADVVTKFLHRG